MRLRNQSILFILLGIFGLISCSHKSSKPKDSSVEPAPQVSAEVAQAPATASPPSATGSQIAQTQEMEIKLKKADEKPNEKPATPVEAHSVTEPATPKVHRLAGPVPADKSLGWLKNGNIRYTKGYLRNDGQGPLDRQRLSTGQQPHAVILSCSDSRVPPEVVFDQKLGEVFVIRTAGENPDAAVIASIEYGIEHAGANLIVVMGHESCGAVKAAIQIAPDQKTGSPYLDRLVSQIQARFEPGRKSSSPGFIQEGWENVNGVAQELITKSKIIREAVEDGSVKIQPALYHMTSGRVEWAPSKTSTSQSTHNSAHN